MNTWDWKLLLTICIVCGVVSTIVVAVLVTIFI
jgi:hypothetical protein